MLLLDSHDPERASPVASGQRVEHGKCNSVRGGDAIAPACTLGARCWEDVRPALVDMPLNNSGGRRDHGSGGAGIASMEAAPEGRLPATNSNR